MKSITLIAFCFLFASSVAQTRNDIVNPDVPMVFLGIDFSGIKFTKADEFNNKDQILRFFDDMNNIYDTEGLKNGIGKRFDKSDMKKDFSYVMAKNASVDWQTVYSDDTEYGLSDELIKNLIKELAVDKEKYKDHLGLVFCPENYCKTHTEGSIAVVIFNVNNNQPLFIKHYSFKPSGYGFFYYWQKITLKAITKIGKIKKEIG